MKEIPALNKRVELITDEILDEQFLKIDSKPMEQILVILNDL